MTTTTFTAVLNKKTMASEAAMAVSVVMAAVVAAAVAATVGQA